jgi:hypothetical protein
MAKAKVIRGTKCLIQLGDGATPTEVFVAPCVLTTKSFELTTETNDETVPDCTDLEAASFVDRFAVSRSARISGSGKVDMDSLAIWRTWALAGVPKNVRFRFDVTGANGGGYYAMSGILASFSTSAENNGNADIEIEIASNGAVAWTAAT